MYFINDLSLPTSASPFAVLLFLPECVRDFKVLASAISMRSIVSNKDKTKWNDRDEMRNECLYRTMSTIWPLCTIWPSLKSSCNVLQSVHSGPTQQHERKRILREKKIKKKFKEWLSARRKWIFSYSMWHCQRIHCTNENCDRAAWPPDFAENVYMYRVQLYTSVHYNIWYKCGCIYTPFHAV